MVLGVCLDMTEKEREVTTSLMIEGFNDCATEARTTVTGGQSIMSPWPIIGGVGISGVMEGDYILPVNAKPGDQIILTKPLATQVAVNAYQWLKAKKPQWEKISNLTNLQELEDAFNLAEESMATLNLDAAKLLRQFNVSACTDVTGFGILGHAKYLAQAQKLPIQFKIHTLPLINNMLKLEKKARDFKLMEGYSAETSGGLLLILPPENVEPFLKKFKETSQFGWHIGEVVKGEIVSNNSAEIVQNVNIVNV